MEWMRGTRADFNGPRPRGMEHMAVTNDPKKSGATDLPPPPGESSHDTPSGWAMMLPGLVLAAGVLMAFHIVRGQSVRSRDASEVATMESTVRHRLAQAEHALLDDRAPDEALALTDEALAALNRSRRIMRANGCLADQLDAEARVLRGRAWLARAWRATEGNASDIASAQEEFVRALDAASRHGRSASSLKTTAYFGLARAQARTESWAEAGASLDRVLTLNPAYGRAYVLRARVRRMLGDETGAREDEVHARSLGEEGRPPPLPPRTAST